MLKQTPPVITVDGPSGVGKGTLTKQLAEKLNWHILESGALYRVLGIAASQHSVNLENHEALAQLAAHLDVSFKHNPRQIILEGKNVANIIGTEECGALASKVAAIKEVREALLGRQRAFLQFPGLVADGRDMGTVVFPNANLKIFLEASPKQRAKRRQLQLKEQGIDVSLDELFLDIEARDKRDRKRAISPLKPALDAIVIDTTELSIFAVYEQVLEEIDRRKLR